MFRIEGYDNYFINKNGEVLNSKRGRFLKGTINTFGYKRFCLSKDGKAKYYFLHCLLAQTFIDNPENRPFIDHINHNRLDNRLSNLRWVTNQENDHNKSIAKNNKSGYQGICLSKSNTWRACISINKKEVRKTFKTIEEAILWRNDMVKIHYPSRPP